MTEPRLAESHEDWKAALDIQHAAFVPDRHWIASHALRMASPRRRSANLWVLEDGGRIASTLWDFHLTFGTPSGEIVGGCGLGGVSTHPELRRRGNAERLCRHVLEVAEGEGRAIGLLFSAIPPEYYARMGFVQVPGWDHLSDRLEEMAASGPRAEWAPLSPERSQQRLAKLYEKRHRGTLHLARDAEAWTRAWTTNPTHAWLGIGGPEAPGGYARLEWYRDVLDLHELVLAEPDAEAEAAALRGLAALGAEMELKRFGHWLEPSPFLREWFEPKPRDRSLPMVRGHATEAPSVFWSSDHF